ncbi:MAG: hypothetical protein ACU836_04115 [Gammaproteobacteria bacterium]
MKKVLISLVAMSLSACSSTPVKETHATNSCIGTSSLPPEIENLFIEVKDDELLSKALGKPNEGRLCQGRVYESKEGTELTLFRAWNSTNPNSQYGNWWAFEMPAGKISNYRIDYEICYQWSPLDSLETCMLKPGTKLVIGTGQSTKCSEYLSYSISNKQQIFIDDAKSALVNCYSSDGEFSWK